MTCDLFPSSNVTVQFYGSKDSSALGCAGTGKVHREVATPAWAVDPPGRDVWIKTATRFYYNTWIC